jgi:prepilin-type N-terminal cleavage/methylation domain-containing protein
MNISRFVNRKGFTMIEIIIVVAIIGIIAGAVMIFSAPTRETSRNNKRISDMQQLYEALGLYKIDNGIYPTIITPGQPLTGSNGVVYLSKVPTNPTPYDDGNCANEDYQYSQDSGGTSYHISFCIGQSVSGYPAGINKALPDGLFATCIPSCVGNCGNDGCGGCCGTCSEGYSCKDNSCVFDCVPESDAEFCARLSKNCDSYADTDNCGAPRTANCGACVAGATPTQMCSSNVCITDPYVMLMLHMNGTNDATTFTDSSASGRIVTVVGNTKLKTAEKVFGTASGYFDGTGDYLTVPNSSDWAFGADDFTIDFWAYRTGSGMFCRLNASSGGAARMYMNHGGVVVSNAAGTATLFTLSYTGTLTNVWQHYALVRSGNVFSVYVDGILGGTATNSVVIGNGATGAFLIGAQYTSNGNHHTGYLDSFRISKGIARWTTDFTPPTGEY